MRSVYNASMETLAHYLLRDLDDTHAFARRLVHALRQPAVIAMTGDLGSGKTTLVQAMAQALAIDDFLPSPTFTLVNEYTTPTGSLIHSDLYRLHDEVEIRNLGLEDYFSEPKTVTIVEWADRAPSLFPVSTLWLRLYLRHDNVRLASIMTTDTAFWETFE